MDHTCRYKRRDLAADALFLAAMAAGSGFTVFMLSTSWPDGAWRLDLAVAAALTACVLLRRVRLAAATAIGLAVAAVAALVASAADLPQEPGPISGMAIAVLIATCLRRGSGSLAIAALLGAATVLAASWFTARSQEDGFTAVTDLLAIQMVVGAACGAVGRGRRSSRDARQMPSVSVNTYR